MTHPPARRSIYRQFAQRLLTPLIVVLLMATAGTIAISYQSQISSQQKQRGQLLDAYAHALIKPLWDCDDQASKGIADSMLQLPAVKSVRLENACTGTNFHSGGRPGGNTAPLDHFGKKLVYRDAMNREFAVGALDIYFHSSSLFKEASDVFWRYLIIIAAMAVSIALGSMLAFRIIISRPLTAFRAAINARIPARDCEALIMTLPLSKRNDELTDVVKAYDVLMDKLLEQKQRLLLQARKDPLTGLGNRIVLEEALNASVQRAKRSGGRGYVLLIDLDEFKPVNDTLGHAAGDFVLQAVARRLLGQVRATDTAARLGGDEFVVILDSQSPPLDLHSVLKRLAGALAAPLHWQGTCIDVKASIGTACFPDDGTECDALLSRADQAMYAEKTTRKRR